MQSKLIVGLLLAMLPQIARAQTVTSIVPDGKAHKFEARDKQFWIDGQPTMLVAGEMHFGRVQPEDWDTRIKQAKAMGLNTISFYLFWNMCEPQEGKFNFTGMTDIHRVIKLCQDNGMWAVLRPGPYCCAEIEYGGIPWWTCKYPDVKIRTADPTWLQWSKRYIEQVYKQVGDLQVTKGGPLLMVQMDNEYGMIAGGNNSYLVELQKIFEGVGFDVQLYTCDPGGPGGRGALPGVLHGANGYQGARAGRGGQGFGARGAQPPASAPAIDYPIYVPELYTNWFTGWGQPLATRYQTIQSVTNWTSTLIDQNCSLCYYVFFGGTNYGFDNGCNEYLPVITSYDYGAPIDEAGRTTEKYRALRDLLSSKLKITPPQPPAEPSVIEIPPIKLDQHEPMLATIGKPTRVSDKPISMENLDQDYGFVLYRKTFASGLKGMLELKNAMDYSIVMVNGKTVGEAFRGLGLDSNKINLPETTGPATLDILVYNLGRISVIVSSRSQDRARKGLLDGATLDGAELIGWENYSLPLAKVDHFKASDAPHTGPTFYRGTFTLDKLGGSFLDMRNWGFGAVWVNGHNIGRHWDRGGIRSLFVPQQWLKQGQNEIVVLELHDAPKIAEVSGGTKIIEEPAVAWAVRLDQAPGRGGGPATGPRGGRRGGLSTQPVIVIP